VTVDRQGVSTKPLFLKPSPNKEVISYFWYLKRYPHIFIRISQPMLLGVTPPWKVTSLTRCQLQISRSSPSLKFAFCCVMRFRTWNECYLCFTRKCAKMSWDALRSADLLWTDACCDDVRNKHYCNIITFLLREMRLICESSENKSYVRPVVILHCYIKRHKYITHTETLYLRHLQYKLNTDLRNVNISAKWMLYFSWKCTAM
jgi:hypothetical protein